MIHTLHVLISKNGDLYREDFKLKNIPMDEVDLSKHMVPEYKWPSEEGEQENMVYIWNTLVFENNEEREAARKNKESKIGTI